MPRNNQRTTVSRQELQRLEARLTSLAGRTARQTGDSDELPVDAVDTVNIANDAVTEDKIADGAVTFKKLASGGTTSGGGGNYSSQAETRRSGATTTTEIYYTARPDGDGYAESEVTTSTPAGAVIERRLYYSDKFDADPDTSGDWTLYTTQPADDTAFATAKASLLAGLSDTDGTANTRGTLPVSLKMEHQFVTDLLLEDYPGAEAAYSVRKIRGEYTGDAMRIREDSGNTETDIGFDSNGNLDTAAIASHCGSANGYVVTWYDQSGNGNDATNSTTTQQPKIYDGSNTISDNGRSAIEWDGVTRYESLSCSSVLVSGTGARSIFSVVNSDNATPPRGDVILSLSSVFTGTGTLFRYNAQTAVVVSNAIRWGNNPQNTQTLGVITYPGGGTTSDIDFYDNGSLATNTFDSIDTINTSSTGVTQIGYRDGNETFNGKMQEIILYASDKSSDRTGIESDIDTYYQPTTALLLDNYSGAASAYSVRKLSQWYTGNCMKVRRDSDDTTQDIGFDSNGDLDTAAIAAFCTTANGYVDTWYDQSGSGYNMTQSTAGSQPRIYDGTAVELENGKPVIRVTSSLNTGVAHMTSTLNCVTSNGWMFVVAGSDGGSYIAHTVSSGDFALVGEDTGPVSSTNLTGTTYLNGGAGGSPDRPTVFSTMGSQGLGVWAGQTGSTSHTYRIGYLGGIWQFMRMQELVIYHSDQSSNRTGIESNINTHYTIY